MLVSEIHLHYCQVALRNTFELNLDNPVIFHNLDKNSSKIYCLQHVHMNFIFPEKLGSNFSSKT